MNRNFWIGLFGQVNGKALKEKEQLAEEILLPVFLNRFIGRIVIEISHNDNLWMKPYVENTVSLCVQYSGCMKAVRFGFFCSAGTTWQVADKYVQCVSGQ